MGAFYPFDVGPGIHRAYPGVRQLVLQLIKQLCFFFLYMKEEQFLADRRANHPIVILCVGADTNVSHGLGWHTQWSVRV